jgi:hypothetical protein
LDESVEGVSTRRNGDEVGEKAKYEKKVGRRSESLRERGEGIGLVF